MDGNGNVIEFRPPQADATSPTSPQSAGVPPSRAPLPQEIALQLDTLTQNLGTALARLGQVPAVNLDPQYRRNLLEQYATLSDVAAQLYTRLDNAGAQPGQMEGIAQEVDGLQDDVSLFITAVESELARGVVAPGPAPASSPRVGGTRWLGWALVAAGLGLGTWYIASRRRPIPAR